MGGIQKKTSGFRSEKCLECCNQNLVSSSGVISDDKNAHMNEDSKDCADEVSDGIESISNIPWQRTCGCAFNAVIVCANLGIKSVRLIWWRKFQGS